MSEISLQKTEERTIHGAPQKICGLSRVLWRMQSRCKHLPIILLVLRIMEYYQA